MSGYGADWLALREPYDTRARDAPLAARLRLALARGRPLTIVDLGAGSGANLRYLAPRLGGRQRWLLFDHAPDLLDGVAARTAAWAGPRRSRLRAARGGFRLDGPGLAVTVETREIDLAREIPARDLAAADLVTASALLDLVSGTWCARLARALAPASPPVLFALSFDGRIAWRPRDALDGTVTGLICRHQRTDKGFGSALGPTAPAAMAAALRRAGFAVAMAPSPWRLDPSAAAMQGALLADWTDAARAIAPGRAAAISAWAGRRAAHIEAGRSHLRVGHRDLLAGPMLRFVKVC